MSFGIGHLMALRALFDCRVIRAHMGSPAFGKLVTNGLAERRYIRGRDAAVKCDYRLAPAGRDFAETVRWSEVYDAR